jgi:hypothetical protein
MPVRKGSIDAVVFAAKAGRKGWAVSWGHPRSEFRQTVLIGARPHAEQFAEGLRAGQDAQRLLLPIWGLDKPVTHADMGRLGGPARAAALSPERRREIAQKALDTRWAATRAAKAAAGDAPAKVTA